VVDPQGLVVSGATVTVTGSQVLVTDSSRRYR
jgi:hypothetical protein